MNNIKYENSLIIEGFDFYKKWSDKPSYILTYENPVIINADDFETLTNMTDELATELMGILIDDFNDNKLEQYVKGTQHFKEHQRIESIKAVGFNTKDSTFTIEVQIKGEPDEEIIKGIEKYIEGQCSDGWGEGFEQTDIGEDIFISTWLHGGEEKGIKIKYKGYKKI